MAPSDTLEPTHVASVSGAPRPARGRSSLWLIAAAFAACAVGVGWRAVAAAKARRAVADAASVAAQLRRSKPRPGRHVHPEPTSFTPSAVLEGTLAPSLEADLAFAVPGRLASIDVRVGDCVRAGQVLARLDEKSARMRLGVAQAEARVAAAQSTLADDANQRTEFLLGTGAVAVAEGVRSKQSVRLADAQRQAAASRVALVANELDEHVLRAPFDGCITVTPKGPGAFVSAGATQLHIVDLSTLRLTGTVNVNDASVFTPGAPLAVELLGGVRPGRVASVVPVVDPVVRRVQVVALVANDGKELALGGLFARARGTQQAAVSAVRIPASALAQDSDNRVWVIEAGKLRTRVVDIGWEVDDKLIVRAGLSATDVVLGSAPFGAKEGDPDVEEEP